LLVKWRSSDVVLRRHRNLLRNFNFGILFIITRRFFSFVYVIVTDKIFIWIWIFRLLLEDFIHFQMRKALHFAKLVYCHCDVKNFVFNHPIFIKNSKRFVNLLSLKLVELTSICTQLSSKSCVILVQNCHKVPLIFVCDRLEATVVFWIHIFSPRSFVLNHV
jgi:hypothetical protein